MKIGCVKEIKNNEFRVGMTPTAAAEYVINGHEVCIETGAGEGSSFPDAEYEAAGAKILPDADAVWSFADMIVKVKEPLPAEYGNMREGQIIYTYFHFAADEALTRACLDKKVIAVAYETMEDARGGLPLLKPMSEVAGSMGPLMGSYFLMKAKGGRGILPTGVPGVLPADVAVLGGGVVGRCAARVAAGMGAKVTILDVNLNTLTDLRATMPANVLTQYSSSEAVSNAVKNADMVIGAVLIPGAKAPKLLKREHLKTMKKGAVVVDIAIDQGGCFETSKATTHTDPVFEVDGVIHYCVANMPGAYAMTSTTSLNNATLQYGLQIAQKGALAAAKENNTIKTGLNTYEGRITYRAVADAFGMDGLYTDPDTLM